MSPVTPILTPETKSTPQNQIDPPKPMLPFDSNKIHAVVGPHPAGVGGKLLLVVEELPELHFLLSILTRGRTTEARIQ
jgi:hypothetical protein